jgi:HD superfamily phosphohydrolase
LRKRSPFRRGIDSRRLEKTQRIRDPIHNEIVFDEREPFDRSVWPLVDESRELQRLRRIKQLGLSEFVFPSATHTRFAHSLGVFHNARRLISLIQREFALKRAPGEFDEGRAKVAVLAALLHDIGHGPFSHSFEEARKAIAGGKIRKHESYSGEMIRSRAGRIGDIIAGAGVNPLDVAELVEAETPKDMYHAVVSSSFDADRLDYLLRDRYMTGVGTGAIDLEWLMDNIRVDELDVSPPGVEGGEPIYTHGFCLFHKAREAAEDFLLARYRLYSNVYFHKTTRGLEQLISALFRTIAREVNEGGTAGLFEDHPLVAFFSPQGETLENYLDIDDMVVWGAIHQIARRGGRYARDIALRLIERKKPFCLDIQVEFPEELEKQRRLKHRLDDQFRDQIGETVFRDLARLSLYGEIGGDDERAQKRLMIKLSASALKEITSFGSSTITSGTMDRPFERYYFIEDELRKKAQTVVEEVRRHP